MVLCRKKPEIYEGTLTKKKLQDACVLAMLFHCMKAAKYPAYAQEQTWKKHTYVLHEEHRQAAVYFFPGGFLAAFSDEHNKDHQRLQDLPFPYKTIAKKEILPYIATPITTFLWGDDKNTFSFDEETTVLKDLLTPYLLDEKEAMAYWKTKASCDRDEVRFVKDLWKHYKKKTDFVDCFVEADTLPFAYPPEGLLALKEGLTQLTITNDLQVRKDIIEQNKRGETYPYYILSKHCVSLSLLYSFRQELFSSSISLTWENSRFTYQSGNSTCIFYFTGQSYVGALLTKDSIKKCYRLPQYITDLFEKESAFITYVQDLAAQGQTHITYFWAEMNTLYTEAEASAFFTCDQAFMKHFFKINDILWQQLSSAQQQFLTSILDTYLRVDLITLNLVTALLKEKQKKTLKIKAEDIQACGFQQIREDILTGMSIEVV